MLPYSPLHHLLLADVGVPLVMTSGNVSDEPIALRGRRTRSSGSPGSPTCFLLHDRPIHTRIDDSVLRGGRIVRRSRGYVPATLPVAAAPPLLAVGAELKNTFALARDGRAWVGHHIGDLRNYETLRSFTDGIAHFERLFAVAPELVAHDLHPEYLSTKYALDLDLPALGVQHHHAHLAACLAEHGVERAAGAIYDGTGYGTDGTVWGGELLRGDLHGFERVGHLWPVRMPGGEAAIREPWRMACAWLAEIGATHRCGHRPDAGSRSPSSPAPASPRRSRRAWAACSTPSPRSAASARPSPTRARPRSSSRPLADRDERAAYPHAAADLDARPTIAAVVDDLGRAASTSRSSPPASTTPSRAPPPRRCATSRSSSSPAASSRTSCCSPARSSCSARARPAAAARSTTAASPTGRRRSRAMRSADVLGPAADGLATAGA